MKTILNLKNPKTLGFVVLAFLALLSFAYIYRSSSPPPSASSPSPTPNPIQPQQAEFRSAKYTTVTYAPSAKFPPLPASLPVYSTSLTSIDVSQVATVLADHLNLTKNPSLPDYWTSSNSSHLLYLDRVSNALHYQIDGYAVPEAYAGSNNPVFQAAVNSAVARLGVLPVFKNLTIDQERINYLYQSAGEISQSNPKQANLIEIPFSQKINAYPVRIFGYLRAPLTFTVGQNNAIVKIDYFGETVNEPVFKDYLFVIPEPDIKTQLESGQGILLDYTSTNLNQPPTKLDGVHITQIGLEYRLDTNNLLSPYYRFTGTYQSPSPDEPPSVTIVLPAARPKN